MLDLATLKATLQPIRAIGEVEERFMIQDIEVCMRVLSPKEEVEIQRWAQQNLLSASEKDRETDNSLAVEYLNRFKMGCLSHSIVEINGIDLRNEDYVATGEILSNGKAVKVKRTEAVIELLENWPRPLLTAVFRKFNEIMERCELESDNSIEFNPPDIQSEIQRLVQRIGTLEEMQQGKENAAAYSDSLNKVATETPKQVSPEPSQTVEQPKQAVNPTERKSAIPTKAAPIEKQQEVVEPEARLEGEDLFDQPKVVSASGSVGTAAAQDGWVDRSDADSMQSAVAAETMRIQEMRKNRSDSNQTSLAANTGASDTGSSNPRFVPPTKR